MLNPGSKGRESPLIKCLCTGVASALFYFLLAPQPVQAYIDPGTGGMIIQGLIALLAGSLAMLGIFWKRVTLSIKKLFRRSGKDANEDEEEDAPTQGTKNKAR